jgi:hypothetical protein
MGGSIELHLYILAATPGYTQQKKGKGPKALQCRYLTKINQEAKMPNITQKNTTRKITAKTRSRVNLRSSRTNDISHNFEKPQHVLFGQPVTVFHDSDSVECDAVIGV